MTDFPSISDLIKKPTAAKSVGLPTTQEKFEDKIKEMDVKAKEEETMARALQLNLPTINLVAFPISAEALKTIPETEARAKKIICFYFMIWFT